MTAHADAVTASPAPLPSTLAVRPHHPLLSRGTDAVQLGLGYREAVEAVEVSAPLLAVLRRLVAHGQAQVADLVELAVSRGGREADVHTLLTELYEVGALLDAVKVKRFRAARRGASVLVDGAGPLAAGVAAALASDGVGTLHLRTGGVVSADDIGPFDAAQRGRPRADSVCAAVHRVAPKAKVVQSGRWSRPDLAVLTDALRPDVSRHDELFAEGVPQLIVRVADGLGLVGPLVLPRRTACLHCLDLHRLGLDPAWPTAAVQLRDRVGSANPTTLAATIALAAEQALLALDSLVSPGAPPPTLDAMLELDLRAGRLHQRHWPPHPGCECGAAHIAGARPAQGGAAGRRDATPGEPSGSPPPAACAIEARR
jgi:bacteriocin biosynthesis cyclodehydratase domain-containing protein